MTDKQGAQQRSSEQELVNAVRAGDRESYRCLVHLYQQDIFGLIMKQVADEALALELTQDAFVKAYLHLKKFRGEAQFKTWLTRIALNVTSSYFTSRRYKQQRATTALDLERYSEQAQESSVPQFDTEMLQRLRFCIATLKPKYRDVVVLCGIEGKTYRETAALLGLPVGTVCSRMNKAFQMLRRKFQED